MESFRARASFRFRVPRWGHVATALALTFAFSNTARALTWPDVSERVEKDLASSDPATRRAAAPRLASLGASRGAPLVLRAMNDPDVDVRLAAARAAVALRVEGATESALPWLGEREPRLRVAACDVARDLPNPRAVPPLARALNDADPNVRSACADALGAQGSRDATEPLAGKLDDSAPSVRVRVASALANLGDPRAVVPLVGKIQDSVPEVRQSIVRALGTLGDARASQALLLALRDNAPEVKVEALGALGRMRTDEASPAIAPLASDRDPTVRQAALAALGRIGSPDAIRALVKLLGTMDDADGGLTGNAIRDALVTAGSRAEPELRAVLERPASSGAANSAAWILGELRATTSAKAILSALRRGVLRPESALHAFAHAGTSAEVPVVLEFLSDANPIVRSEALSATAALLDPRSPDGRAVEPLVAALDAPQTTTDERTRIAKLLGRTGARRAVPPLLGLLGHRDTPLRIAAVDAIGTLGAADPKNASGIQDDALVALFDDPDPTVRLHGALALGASGGTNGERRMLAALDGGDGLDRASVFLALAGILERRPNEATVTRLFHELDLAAGPERDTLIETAGRARLPAALRGLEAVMKGDVEDRRSAVATLGAHRGDTRAIALVTRATHDPDPNVQSQAAYTLGQIAGEEAIDPLASLAKASNGATVTNALAGLATLAERTRTPSARAKAAHVACTHLDDPRGTVRTNALVTLAAAHLRCGDGHVERKLLGNDPSDLVRKAAARAVHVPSSNPDADRGANDLCASRDPSVDVATACRTNASSREDMRPSTGDAPRGVTVFVVTESGNGSKPGAPFLLEYENGILRAGVADRRGATFDPSPSPGVLQLRRPDAL